jgi:hypothetical protein
MLRVDQKKHCDSLIIADSCFAFVAHVRASLPIVTQSAVYWGHSALYSTAMPAQHITKHEAPRTNNQSDLYR